MAAQNNIDNIVLNFFGIDKFFLEAGGSHPIEQNNTYLLENNGWKGLVIEPKTDFNKDYELLRPNTKLVNYVLVSDEFLQEEIDGDFSHYMVGGIINNNITESWNPSKYKCTQLKKILCENNIKEVHFFSLDVEGYENEVLKGIDFEKCFFHLIIVETHTIFDIPDDFSILDKNGFEKIKVLGNNHHYIYINKKSEYYLNKNNL